jgi:prolyl 4-hydroxylase
MMTPTRTSVTFGPIRVATPPTLRPPSAGSVIERLDRHPMVRRVGNGRAAVFIAPEFITAPGRDALCSLIDARRRPSTVADPNGDYAFRTSETCDMDRAHEVVARVQDAICSLLGINPRFAEPLQGQRYGPGQQFKRHGDAFRPGSPDYERYCKTSGQRTWTAMVYLDEPEAGGHTVFADLDLDVKPVPGTMLMWHNTLPDGTPDPMTAHQATPVERGVKRIITQWYRERPWA